MNYFGMTWEEATNEVPYQTLVMLSSSIPKYSKKDLEDEGEKNKNPQGGMHLWNLLGGDQHLPQEKS